MDEQFNNDAVNENKTEANEYMPGSNSYDPYNFDDQNNGPDTYLNESEPTPEGKTDGLMIAALVLGICAIVFGCCFALIGVVCGIAGIICAAMSLKKRKNGMAIAGLVCSIIGLIIGIVNMILGAMMAANMTEILTNLPQ